jgi:HSP20 family protein
MSRLMNGMLEGNGRRAELGAALDVWETPTEVVYAFDLPGIPEDQISIEVNDETLTVSAERAKTDETSENGFYRFERRYGTFARAVGLPQGVDQDNISARYENGVLRVCACPKPEELVRKPRKIELVQDTRRVSRFLTTTHGLPALEPQSWEPRPGRRRERTRWRGDDLDDRQRPEWVGLLPQTPGRRRPIWATAQ